MVKKKLSLLALIIIALSVFLFGLVQTQINKYSGNGSYLWEPEIIELEANTARLNDHTNRVLFIGSSSIRFWSTLTQDMYPFTVIQHGFGGAKVNDVIYFSDRLINAYDPRAVVIFVGTNDISLREVTSAEAMLAAYQQLINNIRQDLSTTPIIFIAITPSPQRWKLWAFASQANQLLTEYVNTQDNIFIVDTSSELLGDDGEPDGSFYKFDGLHLNSKGYAVWTQIVKAELLRRLQP
tara:strand:+ start:3855 stop:4568 length:714 start_codon:yes stop_codon:yes gene_type:complete